MTRDYPGKNGKMFLKIRNFHRKILNYLFFFLKKCNGFRCFPLKKLLFSGNFHTNIYIKTGSTSYKDTFPLILGNARQSPHTIFAIQYIDKHTHQVRRHTE